jgi:hypothetical protein
MATTTHKMVIRPMLTIRTLLLVNGVLTALYAVMLLFMPEKLFFELRGMHPDAYAIFMARLMGPAQVGYAVLSIAASKLQNRETLRLVTIVSCITWTLGLIVFLVGKLTLEMNALVWADISTAVIFSLAFAYFVFFKPEP